MENLLGRRRQNLYLHVVVSAAKLNLVSRFILFQSRPRQHKRGNACRLSRQCNCHPIVGSLEGLQFLPSRLRFQKTRDWAAELVGQKMRQKSGLRNWQSKLLREVRRQWADETQSKYPLLLLPFGYEWGLNHSIVHVWPIHSIPLVNPRSVRA